MTKSDLITLAQVIGWEKVNDDKGYSLYEYRKAVNRFEEISHLVKILDEPTDMEVYEMLLTLKNVLPFKLQHKLNKIIRNVKISSLPQIVEVISFTVDEFKQSTKYAKLQQYGDLLGVDLEKMGYKFMYTMPKKLQAEILSKIELNLPMEIAPTVGKIRKLDYKIAFVKKQNSKVV